MTAAAPMTRTTGAAVLARFEEWAAAAPQAPAVVDGPHRWSYAEVSEAADRAAGILRDRVRPGDLVGVCLDRSAALVVTAVALARLGAVYLPLGPRPGARRTEAVTEDLDVVCLIGAPEVLPPRHRDAERVALPLPVAGANAVDAVVAAFAERPEGARRAPEGSFYAVLTSGSTGRPKAVAVGERSLTGLLDWYREAVGLAPGDRQSLLIGVAFDPHLLELWAGLTSGAALVPAPDEVRWDPSALTDWWREAAVTVAVAATPMVEPLLDRPWPKGLVLRQLVSGGDRMRRHPGPEVTATVHNAYGPAEATVVTTVHTMRPGEGPADRSAAPPIGRPIPGASVLVTDGEGRPVPPGAEGELRIGGDCLALGYLDPELTAHRFAQEGGTRAGSGRWYRTGDRVRMRADGLLEFLGRLDDQVKISGVRIEPAEVEAAFEQDPSVRGAVVTVARTPEGRARLVAHVRPVPGARPTASALLSAVRGWLPEQAVPGTVRITDAFPLDANGKVDRAELARRAEAPAPAAGSEGNTFGERLVLAAVRELLGRPDAALDEGFTAAGGTSLAAARLLTVIEDEAGIRLRASALLRQPDLRSIAALVDAKRADSARPEGN
ncbi:non-ribosomal peptide synthetase [Streptomyces lichenis]|uniref:Non-ribosomal peptide synthetase n=1 Tax=Streptomyces lichenis TaxID=2306967 RepID=A0ABT0IBU0_9ACTN|nr:non-ribosomal peptide synthetase [Streptomyces lichenis]MCK8678781.1 non-ribosomal peptide synthetase [Streptomyces lichenis]